MPEPDSAAAILADLAVVRARLELVEDERDALYADRLALFWAGRCVDPPVHQRAMADVLGVTEVAVTQALAKDRKRRLAQGLALPTDATAVGVV